MGGLGGLLGFKDQPPDPNAQKPDETQADYAARRQQTRFGQMAQEVDGLLKKYPATEELPANAYSEERRGLRQRGFDQKEEDAIISAFAKTQGTRQGILEVQKARPSFAEGEVVPGSASSPQPEAGAEEELPKGSDLRRDNQIMDLLMQNYIKSGRDRGGGSPKSWPGFET